MNLIRTAHGSNRSKVVILARKHSQVGDKEGILKLNMLQSGIDRPAVESAINGIKLRIEFHQTPRS